MMGKLTNFIKNMKSNKKAVFIGTIAFFYIILMALWIGFLVSGDCDAPAFIYEQF